ncbi:MAG: cytochrome P450 [Anaerolineales bacterium]|nr:cytochrome P450 [Anaerolineales bacterium]
MAIKTEVKAPPMVSGKLPVLGHLMEYRRDRTALLRRGYEEHGRVFAIKLGPQNVAVLIGPENQKTFFMETDKKLSMEEPYKFLRDAIGNIAFLAEHETYVEQRPILHEPFKRHKMPQYVSVMQEQVQKWLDTLGDEGQFELTSAMNLLVQEVAGYALMGEDFQQTVGREFWEQYEFIGKALDPVLPPNLPLPKFRRRDKARQRMGEILEPIIAERRKNPDQYNDFLQDIVNKPYKDGRPVEDDVIISLMIGLMFAGHETTAGQSAWTIIELLKAPDMLALVEQEILRHAPPGTELSVEVLAEMPHIAWAVREIERLHPSADMVIRYAREPIEAEGYTVPEGWLVQTAAMIAHQLPEVFADPEQYDPLRYAPGREEDKQHRFTLVGFGGGVHRCTGMNFANNEQSVIVALLLQQFELTLLNHDQEIDYGLGANRPTETWIQYKRRPITERVVLAERDEAAAGGCPVPHGRE